MLGRTGIEKSPSRTVVLKKTIVVVGDLAHQDGIYKATWRRRMVLGGLQQLVFNYSCCNNELPVKTLKYRSVRPAVQ